MRNEAIRKTCVKCGHEFTYREKLQSMYRILWRMNCKECGTRYSVLVRYRLAFGLLCVFPIVFGPTLTLFYSWNLESVLIFDLFYFVFLLLLGLFLVLFIPRKLDSVEKEESKEMSIGTNN